MLTTPLIMYFMVRTHTPSHEYRYVLKQLGAEAEPMGMAMLFSIFTLSATIIILALGANIFINSVI